MMEPIGGKKLAIEEKLNREGGRGKDHGYPLCNIEVITKHERVVFM